MSDPTFRPAMLCISSYEKGHAFLQEAAKSGCAVILLTVERHRNGEWPHETLTEFVIVRDEPGLDDMLWHAEQVARRYDLRRIVALDEFDQQFAAEMREFLQLPGLNVSIARFFRDKLAMRQRALIGGVPVPEFTGVFHRHVAWEYMQRVPGPWLLKPRLSASAIGIRRIAQPEDLWQALDELGDGAGGFLLERFVPGEVYHVEGVTYGGQTVFSEVHKYFQPPIKTMHEGGVFSTRTLDRNSAEVAELRALQVQVLAALGLENGVSHTEFLRAQDGKFYFLETGARVGGAHIADVVQNACGINPWIEWARIEVALLFDQPYALPPLRHDYACSVICLARQEWPDTSAYTDPEIVERLHRLHHAGLLLQSSSAERVQQLVEDYASRFPEDFLAIAPVPDRPSA